MYEQNSKLKEQNKYMKKMLTKKATIEITNENISEVGSVDVASETDGDT